MSVAPRRRVMHGLGLAAALLLAVPARRARADVSSPDDAVDVWVDLSEPELASLPRQRGAEHAALAQRVARQQATVMAALAELRGIELGRVQRLRNAIAVRLPRQALAQARRIAGVRHIRPIQDRHTSAP